MRGDKQRGLTVFELLTAVFLSALLLTLGINGFKSFHARVEVTQAVRAVTSTLHSARYLSMRTKRAMKVEFKGKICQISEKREGTWKSIKQTAVEDGIGLEANAKPVFYPTGFATPLCTVRVWNRIRHVRITLSSSGRVKVYDNG